MQRGAQNTPILPKMKRRIGPTALRMGERTEERRSYEAPRIFFNM